MVAGVSAMVMPELAGLCCMFLHCCNDMLPDCSITGGGGGMCGEVESGGGGSVRIHHLTGVSPEGRSRFPKLEECAHFHYEHVELGSIQISLCEEESLRQPCDGEGSSSKAVTVRVTSGAQSWLLRRTYDNFRMLDQQLHRCIYDRKFSNLTELPQVPPDSEEGVEQLLSAYVTRLSTIAGNLINCGPVLSWLELDNRGRRLLVTEGDNCPINTPAVAAAYSIKKYTAVAADEISFDIGDMISVIDMPPPEESAWWRGKRGFLVGFFPSHCVAVITDKLPRNLNLHQSLTLQGPTKPVLRKHGKLIAFFRAFILSRPSRRRLKQSGILKERVFGCDLGEHLLNSGHDIPMVLKCCSEFIESHGIVDGIYRLSGVTSNIQKLRRTFDEDRVPALYEDEAILQDIHSVASLLKMYFRELPNPLCTYQLYDAFVTAVQTERATDERLLRMREAVEKLPPPHYRTLEYLMRHLARVSERGSQTGMTARNVAIVWAPNLLRCKELEVGGVAALQGVGVQAVVTEFLIVYADLIFCSAPLPTTSTSSLTHVTPKRVRPKSLAISTPTKLLSLEEAQSRALAAGKPDQDYIEVGGGPACLPAKYHTVIELPRKRAGSKRSPLGWRSLFGKSSRTSHSTHKSRTPVSEQRKSSVPTDIVFGKEKALTESDLTSGRRRLRPVKSAESLASGQTSARSSSCLEPPSPPTPPHTAPPHLPGGHNRSVSHDSYFDTLTAGDTTPRHNNTTLLQEEDEEGLSLSIDLSELQVNFDFEESDMRIFSEDETNQLFSSHTSLENQVSKKQPLLARAEDSSSDPSPKKHKTGSNSSTNRSKRSRLEERLSNAELRYIDSGSPDQVETRAEIHTSPPSQEHSPSLAEATVSENESLTLSGLTTPDTPTPHPVTTPQYTPLTDESPSPQPPQYENVSRNRLSFQGFLKNGDLGICTNHKSDNEIQYENLDGEDFCRIDCNITAEIMDAVMSESKMLKYEEVKESSIYESVDDDKKENFYENVTLLEDSELYEPVMKSPYEEIPNQECLVGERLRISSLGSLISPAEADRENDYECLVLDSSPDSNHNLPPPSTPAVNPEEHLYEDVQTVPLADSLVYQQVKYLKRSVHEINQLLEETMEPFTAEDVSSLEEEETALISPMNNGTPDKAIESVRSPVSNIKSAGPDQNTSVSRRFEEARLESSDSLNTPTMQTESVTSVSVSPLLETNNIVSTEGSDKDLLYENSTMDDVEAISTSYEEPGRSVEMLFDYSNSKSAQESLQDQNRSVEMVCDTNSKSAMDDDRSVDMICEESNSKSQDSVQGTGQSVEMLLESNSRSKDSLEQEQSVGLFGENTNSKSTQESLEGHEKIVSGKLENSSTSDKDTDKQIDCHLSEMDSFDTSRDCRALSYSLDGSTCKIESEKECKMVEEPETNSSSTTGHTTNSGRNVHELMSRFEWSQSRDSLPPCQKARVSRQNSKDNAPTLTTSLDASTFPSDNQPLTRVKTSPDLIQNQDNLEQKQSDNSVDSEAVRRERIEKYKEERRTFLRKKYRTDSFNNNDDKDEEMIRRLKAKANVRAVDTDENNCGGGDSLESMEWSRRSPSRKLEDSGNEQVLREKELENRLSDSKPLKKSPSKTLVSISYSPTKTKAPGWDSCPKNKSPEIERIPDRIVFNRSVSLNTDYGSARDAKSVSDRRHRPEDLNLSGISSFKKDDSVLPKVGKSERRSWRGSEECRSPDESLVQRRVNQLSSSFTEVIKNDSDSSDFKRRTSLTDLVKPPSSSRQRANSGSSKSPSYCIRDMAAMFEKRDIK
ncbi:uncharacterized protein LOC128983900 isoform X2 [Macrosteles quadrilineatus]|uniref:uncharacterized protein LOC128983900 isoform X2 n=1 Tax=Macrosteles quadrilineatus TaxID=74068 RepID=UPI0023E1083E|nr:uncharacterized protein LOC128983900 isoform X2 [Macrosteles quadrilineatus]